MRGLARWGLVAKGISYGIVAFLAFKVASGSGGRVEDRQGALRVVADEPFGRFLLALVAVGLAGYALWRFAQAFLGENVEGGEDEGLIKRASFVARGLFYTVLCVVCVSFILQSSGSSGKSNEEDRATSFVLELPLGVWIVGLAGLAFIGAGLFNGYRAVTRKFLDQLKTRKMSEGEERVYTVVGVIGHLARMVVFSLVGIFLVRAAYQYDPKETVGLDGALSKVAQEDYGNLLLGLLAAGLLAYGLFCLVQARYREV